MARFGACPAAAPTEAVLWWLAGLITVADWIGSDEDLFPPDGLLGEALREEHARMALCNIGWRAAALRPGLGFGELFPDFAATPLQRAAFERINRPGAYLIEGAMGCGKTEAALAAAYRLISGGHAGGLYFALPTQTTSNKIHERVDAFLSRIEARPHELRLAHGTAWLREDFHMPILSPSFAKDDRSASRNVRDEDEAVAVRDHVRAACSWFASGKRALLTSFGVGTVDQALLGIVAAKHFFVRQFGLAGKVVILDEIHTYDLYTGTLLDNLVKRLRELRCTVIILSATLTGQRREELIRAAGAIPIANNNDYPLITLAPEGKNAGTISLPADTPKTIQVATTKESDAAIADTCLERAEAGQCVLWIRNTVDEAQASYRLLKSANRQDGPHLGLLHARFPLWRREQLEQLWLEALGKESNNRPQGCVLVATQVVEQSVDIDADFLATDLAPTDMLLQRIGRLWRHTRPNRPGRSEVLIQTGLTLENFRNGSAVELKTLLGRSVFVYAPYLLLRTFDLWTRQSQIELPGDIRMLLEETYRDATSSEPVGWTELAREIDDSRKVLRQAADLAALVRRQPALADEEGVQTRWTPKARRTLHLLLATASPDSLPGHRIRLMLADGTTTDFPDFRFDLAAARAVHSNLVRIQVPVWRAMRLLSLAGTPPEWLESIAPSKTVLGVVRKTDGAILFGDMESGMTWHLDEGVTFPRRAAPSSPATTPTTDYDDDEPYD
ncbi:MAG TPA: CRISPR-associated helicase Cas3' [Candidatus Paceibacterota bacterium]|nr:CRISPR-associated helicase Cas3' [Verrucomicrobiota bacterium]HRY50315.1 CRISPR-associated helicase Cas3' [Candidatus Paceibacterota bacterium]